MCHTRLISIRIKKNNIYWHCARRGNSQSSRFKIVKCFFVWWKLKKTKWLHLYTGLFEHPCEKYSTTHWQSKTAKCHSYRFEYLSPCISYCSIIVLFITDVVSSHAFHFFWEKIRWWLYSYSEVWTYCFERNITVSTPANAETNKNLLILATFRPKRINI